MTSTNSVKSMYDELKRMNAGEVHATINKPFGDQNVTLVIGVYDNQKPAHMVLQELHEWAELTNNVELLAKIESLETDVSFLNK